MKKLLVLFLVILMAGCSAKTLKWEDVKESYAEMENASTTIAKPEAYLKSDYLMIFDQIKEELTSLVKGVEKDAEDNVRALYQNAVNLEWIVSDKDNEGSNTFKDLCYGLKKIVEAAYMKSEDFDTLKNSLLEQVDAIRGWNDEQWAQVEIRATLKWADVESDYEAMEEAVKEELKKPAEVSEYDLEEPKDVILNNYEAIADGVTEVNRAKADQIYKAAVTLYEYTKELKEESGMKVASFASQAKEYVKNAYGVKPTDPEYNFDAAAAAAKKYSLSLWNEITTELKINRY